jgi:RimJ/RimL family protein N-acetyltransferase
MSRVQLRPYTEPHASSVVEAAHESVVEVHPWLPWCHPNYQLSEAQDWIRGQIDEFASGSAFQFAIESSGGAYLGGCGLNQINSLHQFANLGYWVRSSQVGQGVATQAVRLLARWAFSHTPLVRLEIVTAVGNKASQRVAKKAGAVREGLLHKRLQIHGVWHDAILFSITRGSEPAA